MGEMARLMLAYFLTALGILLVLGYTRTVLEFMWGNRGIQKLAQVTAPPDDALPSLSIIIPARNEERGIQAALKSVLKLDYPAYEVIVLNDRSEDNTGPLLEAVAEQHPQLRIVHIQTLPEGWLGKNYALWTGAQMAQGKLLLFTDADVVFEPSAVRRAVGWLQSQKLDHLSVLPELLSRNFDLSVFLGAFSIFFCLYSKPWNAKNKKSKSYIGIGAFNLISKTVYEAIGTHQRIALRPDDDMKLGKCLKSAGFSQDLCDGTGLVQVEWYHSLSELIDGLMKNAFAGLDYSLVKTIGALLSQFLFCVWPVIALWIPQGQSWWLYVVTICLMQLLCLIQVRRYRMNPLTGLFFPLSGLLLIYIIAKATVLTLKQDGIRWRGTHYPLSALKRNTV